MIPSDEFELSFGEADAQLEKLRKQIQKAKLLQAKIASRINKQSTCEDDIEPKKENLKNVQTANYCFDKNFLI